VTPQDLLGGPICGCGQELDGGPRRHCTRCGLRWPGASDLSPSRCASPYVPSSHHFRTRMARNVAQRLGPGSSILNH